MNTAKTVKDYIRSIPDFPEPGIIFRDLTSVLQDADGLQLAIDEMQEKLAGLEAGHEMMVSANAYYRKNNENYSYSAGCELYRNVKYTTQTY